MTVLVRWKLKNAPRVPVMKRIFSIALLGLAVAWPALGNDGEEAAELERERFLKAYEAGLQGDTDQARQLASKLSGYVLEPYLDYAILKGRLDEADEAEVRAFLEAHGDTPLDRRMRVAWLHELASRKAWSKYLSWYRPYGDTTLRCHWATARVKTGQLEGVAEAATELWLAGRSQPDACDPAFDWLYATDRLSHDHRYERVVRALEAGQVSLARWLADKLPAERRVWYLRWRQMMVSPEHTLESARGWQDNASSRRIVLYGLRALGRSDEDDKAWQAFKTLDAHFDFTSTERGVLLRQLALDAATDYHDDALDHLDAVPDGYVDASVRQWRVRVALHRRDWPAVLDALDRLTGAEQSAERWRYWRARALEATGDQGLAAPIYASLAKETSYYGFLAADRVDAPYRLESTEIRVPERAVDGVAARPAMSRALELYHVGLYLSARREWNQAVAGGEPDTLRAAALLAARAGWHDRAILALANTADWSAYELRFPVAHEALVNKRAEHHGLDPAWLYGLIRAESSFITDARSPAGALGLMQVMPGTGERVAGDIGLGWSGSTALLEPEHNVAIGSAYLAQLMDRYDGNRMLATAAYNAGENAVDRWIKENDPGHPAIWADTIPFHETRAYIQRVMAYSALYDWRLDRQVVRLSDRMPFRQPALVQVLD